MTRDPFRPAIDEAIPILESRLRLLFNDLPKALDLMREGLEFRAVANIENRISAFKGLGLFSAELMEALFSGGEAYKPAVTNFLWERLVAAGICPRAVGALWNTHADHHIDLALLRCHLNDQTFRNLFSPPAALVKRYGGALVAVDVTIKSDKSRGSGFVVSVDGACWLVTCKHNVDPEDGITQVIITDSAEQAIEMGAPILSPTHDIAIYRLDGHAEPTFRLSADVEVFDAVYTLGYPMVPGAQPLIVGHRGEVNGVADLYLAKTEALLISNLVAPGSSGCPVIDSEGHCVGMTIRWLEAEYDKERVRYSAALPAAIILDFIKASAALQA